LKSYYQPHHLGFQRQYRCIDSVSWPPLDAFNSETLEKSEIYTKL
jgi:hypothetical protein